MGLNQKTSSNLCHNPGASRQTRKFKSVSVCVCVSIDATISKQLSKFINEQLNERWRE